MKESDIKQLKKGYVKKNSQKQRLSSRASVISFGTIESDRIVEEMAYEDVKSVITTTCPLRYSLPAPNSSKHWHSSFLRATKILREI